MKVNVSIFIYFFKLMFSDLNSFSQWHSAYVNSVTNLVEMSNGSVRNRGIPMQKHLSFLLVFYAAWHSIYYIMAVRRTLVILYEYFSHVLEIMNRKLYLYIIM